MNSPYFAYAKRCALFKMTEDYNIFIQTLDGQVREVQFAELNQLKKDILWIFDENTTQLNSPFVPEYSFLSDYWEYLTLNGNEWFYETDRNFYKQGVLIIILCMTIEYIDTEDGNQRVFGKTKLNTVIQYVQNFQPTNTDQDKLKKIVALGLDIANSMTENDLINSDGYQHQHLDSFYSQLSWVDITFIKSYFQSLTK